MTVSLPSGHDRPCCVCAKPCDALAGNPGRWPLHLGNQRDAHVECVNRAIIERDRAYRTLVALPMVALDPEFADATIREMLAEADRLARLEPGAA